MIIGGAAKARDGDRVPLGRDALFHLPRPHPSRGGFGAKGPCPPGFQGVGTKDTGRATTYVRCR